MSFTYPDIMKANPVTDVSHEQMLEKLSEICTGNSIAWWPKLQYINAGYRDAIKAVLRQLYVAHDKLQERVYMEKDISTMFANFFVGEQDSEIARLAKLLNYVSDHPESEK